MLIRDSVRGQLGIILSDYELMMRGDKPRVSITIEAILAIKEIAIIDRDAELDKRYTISEVKE